MKHPLLLAGLTLALCACNAQAPGIDVTPPQPTAKRAAMEWYAYNTGEKDGIPQNTLKLKTATTSRDELFTTTCVGTTLVEGVQDMDDSVASIQCWWAGGGDQFGVFIGDGEQAVIRHRTVDEEAGYGKWEDLKTL